MTIFDILSDILFKKKKTTVTNIDTENIFSPYMVNRWTSMYSNQLALKSNLLNKFLSLNKQSLFTLFFNIFDKVSIKKINYFKKTKDKDIEENDVLYAKALEVSIREIKQNKDLLNSLKH